MMLSYWVNENEELLSRLTVQVTLQKHGEYWEQNPAEFLTTAEEALISLLVMTAAYNKARIRHGEWFPQDEIDATERVLSSVSVSYNA